MQTFFMKKTSSQHHEKAPQETPTLLPGIKPVLELLQSQPERVDTLYFKKGLRHSDLPLMLQICRDTDIRFSEVDTYALDRLCTAQHQGIIARLTATARITTAALWTKAVQAPLPLIVALDQVQDPGNVGTLARTLYALGGGGMLLPKHNSAYLGPAANKSAAGTLEKLPIACATNLGHALDEAEEMGFTIVGTGVQAQGQSLNAFCHLPTLPMVLVLGSEDKGLRPSIAKRCSTLLHIPMQRRFDSLNVAQAGGILLGLLAKQQYSQ